jgi:hypothetical protein
MTRCKLSHVKLPRGMSRRSSKKRRSRIMKNLHIKTKKKSGKSRRSAKSRKRRRRKKHTKTHKKRKHRSRKNVGGKPIIDGFDLRNIILANTMPEPHIVEHMPDMHRLHKLLAKLHPKSEHGFNMPLRKDIFSKLLPNHKKSDEENKTLQKYALKSIISDLEAMD